MAGAQRCSHGLPSTQAGAPAPETGQLAVSMTYLFLLVFHVTFLKQTEQLYVSITAYQFSLFLFL